MPTINLQYDGVMPGQNLKAAVGRYQSGAANDIILDCSLSAGAVIILPDGTTTTMLSSALPGSTAELVYDTDSNGCWYVVALQGVWNVQI
jgi:hypothetical protein